MTFVNSSRGGGTAAIPVAKRRSGQGAACIHQAVVHGPGVDANAGNHGASCGGMLRGCLEPQQDLVKEPLKIPEETPSRSTTPLGKRCTTWRSALPAVRLPTMTRPEDAPMSTAANKAAHRRKAAATPASTGMCRPVVWESSAEVSTAAALATFSGSTSRLSRVRCA